MLLVGDAGIGKTRLLEELRAIVGRARHVARRGSASPTAVFPSGRSRRSSAGGSRSARQSRRSRHARALGRASAPCSVPAWDDVLAPFGGLLRIDLDPDSKPESANEAAPPAIRRAFCDWVEALAANQPVVIAVEDMHWAAPQAREMAEALLELTDRAAVMVVATLRAEPGLAGMGLQAARARELRPPHDRARARAARRRRCRRARRGARRGQPRRRDVVVGGRPRRGQPALSRGARAAPARGGGRRAQPHLDAHGRPGDASGAPREPARRTGGRAARGRTLARPDRRGDRPDVRGVTARAGRGHGRRRRGAARSRSGRDRAGASAVPRARVRLRTRATPRSGAVDADDRAASGADDEGRRHARGAPRRARAAGGRAARAVLHPQQQARPGRGVPRARRGGEPGRPRHAVELLEAAARAAAREGDVEAERRLEARLAELAAGA